MVGLRQQGNHNAIRDSFVLALVIGRLLCNVPVETPQPITEQEAIAQAVKVAKTDTLLFKGSKVEPTNVHATLNTLGKAAQEFISNGYAVAYDNHSILDSTQVWVVTMDGQWEHRAPDSLPGESTPTPWTHLVVFLFQADGTLLTTAAQ